MAKPKTRSRRKLGAVAGVALLFATGFFVIGLFVDMQIILKYNYTPIPFTFILPFVGALTGFLLALRTIGLNEQQS